MIRIITTVGTIGILLPVLAGTKNDAVDIRTNAATKLERQMASRMRSYGGDIIDRRNAKGEFYVVNAQNLADEKLLNEALAAATSESSIRVDPKIVAGTFDLASPSVKGRATLFLVDDKRYPMSLIAPEARWALVNVARLKSDKPAFFGARVKKEVCRAVGQLFGAFSNQYELNLFSGVFSVEDLDQITSAATPFEYRMRYQKYLPQMGIEPYRVVHYKRAVQEGWAPAPTNEYQKAIWDKVHAIPKNPMKIEFDPKKGR